MSHRRPVYSNGFFKRPLSRIVSVLLALTLPVSLWAMPISAQDAGDSLGASDSLGLSALGASIQLFSMQLTGYYPVSNETELRDAILGGRMYIQIMNDIMLENPLVINGEPLTIGAASTVTLTTAGGVRHIAVTDDSNLGFFNIVLDGERSGGGIEITTGSLRVEHFEESQALGSHGLIIENCHNADGGGIEMNTAGGNELELSGVVLKNNVASGNGGAIYVEGNGNEFKVSDEGLHLIGNQAGRDGGGLYTGDHVLVELDPPNGELRIQENHAERDGGGACFTGNASDLYIGPEVLVIDDNVAGRHGGGLYMGNIDDIRIDPLVDGSISGNSANGGNGGGIYLGLVDALGFHCDNVNLDNNKANGSGGGVYIDEMLHNHFGPFEWNRAVGNRAGENGGAFFFGATASGESLNVKVEAGELRDNLAEQNGGALYFDDLENMDNITLEVQSAEISGNQARAGSGGVVGAREVEADDFFTLQLRADIVENNTAAVDGGVISVEEVYAWDYTLIDIEAETMSGNSAGSGNGGVVRVGEGGGDYFYLNLSAEAVRQNTAGESGGAVYVGSLAATEDAEVSVAAEEFSHNEATGGSGGGIYLGDSIPVTGDAVLRFQSEAAEYNQAGENGGVIRTGENITVFLEGDDHRLANNTAGQSGGALYLEMGEGRLELEGGWSDSYVIEGNQALDGDGGAIYLGDQTGEDTMIGWSSWPLTAQDQILFVGNSADNGNGGAIWAETLNALYVGHLVAFMENGASKKYQIAQGDQSDYGDRIKAAAFTDGDAYGYNNLDIGYLGGDLVTYTLTYHDNHDGRTRSSPGLYGAVTVEDNPFQREGYFFTGWNTQPNGGGTTYQPGETIFIRGNTILYAQWVQGYSLTYSANDGSGREVRRFYEPGKPAVVEDKLFERDGYLFAGWNAAANGTGADYAEGSSIIMDGNKVLYARWVELTNQYTLRYDANGAEGLPPVDPNSPYDEGATVTVLAAGDLSRSGYSFAGWSATQDGTGALYQPGDRFDIQANMVLYAVWEQDYTLTYHANDSSGREVQRLYKRGLQVTVEDKLFERDGHRFTGWNTAANGTGVAYSTGSPLTMDSDKALYAQWEELADQYTVRYDANGAEGLAPVDPASPYDKGDTVTVLAAGDLNRKGHLFAGWNTRQDGSGTAYQPGDHFAAHANTVLYAQWKDVTFAVTYYANGGQGRVPVDAKSPYRAGETVTVLERGTLNRPGYAFAGWNTGRDGRGAAWHAGDTFVISADVTLYAMWTLDGRTGSGSGGGSGNRGSDKPGSDTPDRFNTSSGAGGESEAGEGEKTVEEKDNPFMGTGRHLYIAWLTLVSATVVLLGLSIFWKRKHAKKD